MQKWPQSLLGLIAILAGLSMLLVPEKYANAERKVSPYCMGTAPVKKIVIEASEKQFVPDTVEVKKGDCIEISINATGSSVHYLVLDGTGITSKGAPLISDEGKQVGRLLQRQGRNGELTEGRFSGGDKVELKFQINKTGTYQLQCKKQKMSVAIVVSP